MDILDDILYTKDHEWARVDDNIVTVGITDYAQEALGDIVFVELPQEGDTVVKEDTFGVVESVKTVSDLYAPVSGKVIEVNGELADSPETVNADPFGEGWMIKIEMEDDAELETLLSPEDYGKLVKEIKK